MTTSLAPSQSVTNRDPKGRKFMDIVAAAYDKAGLSDEEAQRVNEASGLSELIAEFIGENRITDRFEDEEVESICGYLSGYTPGSKSLAEQCNALRVLFPGIGFANHDYIAAIEKGEVTLPQNAEGWFAIPNWVKNQNIFGTSYMRALEKVLATIKQARNGQFYNDCEGQLDGNCLRPSGRSRVHIAQLSAAQGDPDILIVPAQFGLRHRGRSVSRARVVFTFNEFGLGAFAVGCMLLTHPERLQNYDDLWLDCSGDKFDDPDDDGRFTFAPCFIFDDGEAEFGPRHVSSATAGFGSVSGFVPPA